MKRTYLVVIRGIVGEYFGQVIDGGEYTSAGEARIALGRSLTTPKAELVVMADPEGTGWEL